jgi:cytochrome c2
MLRAAALDKFPKKPTEAVPGTIMTYDGVPGDRERADVIAYLETANASKELCPQRAVISGHNE